MDAIDALKAADRWSATGHDLAFQMLALAEHFMMYPPGNAIEAAEAIEQVVEGTWRPADNPSREVRK